MKAVMIARTRVAASAPSWVRDRLIGPVRDVAVVHSGTQALYVAVADGSAGRCVGVLSRSAAAVPCGLRTLLPDLSVLSGPGGLPSPGDILRIGEGRLTVGDFDIDVVRTVNAAVPALDPSTASAMAGRLRTSAGARLGAIRAELSTMSLTLLAHGDPAAVPLLLGRGSGLTPVGDDVLAGWLAALHASGLRAEPVAQRVGQLAADSTTLLSATLLDRARAGDVLPEFQRLLLDLRPAAIGRAERLDADVEALLHIGHTSGAGLMLGCLLALDHLSRDHPTARSQRS